MWLIVLYVLLILKVFAAVALYTCVGLRTVNRETWQCEAVRDDVTTF